MPNGALRPPPSTRLRIPLVDEALQLGRGVTQAVQGAPQGQPGGLGGFFRRLQDPRPAEDARQAEGVAQANQEQQRAILATLDQAEADLAQDPTDIDSFVNAVGQFQRFQGEVFKSVGGNERAFSQVVEPVQGRVTQVFGQTKAGQDLIRLGGGQIPPGVEGSKGVADIFARQKLGAARGALAGLRGEQANTEKAKQEKLAVQTAAGGFAPRIGAGGGGGGGPRLTDLDRITARIDAEINRLNDPNFALAIQESETGQRRFQSGMAALRRNVDEHNRRAAQLGVPPLEVLGDNPGQVSVVPVQPLGDELGADIGTGGFSLAGAGEIPEGQFSDQQVEQARARVGGGLTLGGGGGQAAPPFPEIPQAAQFDPNQGLQPAGAIQDPTQQQAAGAAVIPPLPPEVIAALNSGQQVSAGQLVQFYVSQGFSGEQAKAIVRDIRSGRRPELLGGQ